MQYVMKGSKITFEFNLLDSEELNQPKTLPEGDKIFNNRYWIVSHWSLLT